ncbi:3-oxoacyl-[acyl-carrier protein] reductase [Rhodopseudomonas thermotolerans]|uniref:3-oxoacyl-[acyl-carrier protein] reductase n=2 Tax=Rhodopseudomonas TaxID=1073 RepID=A0A336JNB5_9BRAD|nr:MULTISPECIES: glucose 1-dehydrogenase [Rhodopseudomonas]RED34411.1 3-oxoacyl-[acyl-carrier protein] reductase [Rhodopseudomonas pentothenatexigens]REG02607.1 3-oxoacyl-[acyl-carrier protein] reductase [Rhodopseudomonas thermotolerans]SSW91080.1 3-oxoacyl-[acyl-carrier protein] reductase [Rhodopseudomonas pentothenatexigens]
MTKTLQGKVALVTGASKGIGAAIALKLAAEGAAVAVNYASGKDGADAVVAKITAAGGKAVAVHGNLAEPDDAAKLVGETVKALGKIDVLVNNAGVYEMLPLDAITPAHFHHQFNVNVLGLLLVTQAAARHFNDGGSIVNISSGASTLAMPNTAVYGATKASVDLITGVLAKELGPRRIRVNAVNPGMVVTEGVRAAGYDSGEMRKQIEAITPLGRVGEADEIAAVVAFLASDAASYVTGETLHVTGGLK